MLEGVVPLHRQRAFENLGTHERRHEMLDETQLRLRLRRQDNLDKCALRTKVSEPEGRRQSRQLHYRSSVSS
jgi:hypothetical protein